MSALINFRAGGLCVLLLAASCFCLADTWKDFVTITLSSTVGGQVPPYSEPTLKTEGKRLSEPLPDLEILDSSDDILESLSFEYSPHLDDGDENNHTFEHRKTGLPLTSLIANVLMMDHPSDPATMLQQCRRGRYTQQLCQIRKGLYLPMGQEIQSMVQHMLQRYILCTVDPVRW